MTQLALSCLQLFATFLRFRTKIFILILSFLVKISYRKSEFLSRDEVAHGHDTCGTSGTSVIQFPETTDFSLKHTGLSKPSTALSLIMVR